MRQAEIPARPVVSQCNRSRRELASCSRPKPVDSSVCRSRSRNRPDPGRADPWPRQGVSVGYQDGVRADFGLLGSLNQLQFWRATLAACLNDQTRFAELAQDHHAPCAAPSHQPELTFDALYPTSAPAWWPLSILTLVSMSRIRGACSPRACCIHPGRTPDQAGPRAPRVLPRCRAWLGSAPGAPAQGAGFRR